MTDQRAGTPEDAWPVFRKAEPGMRATTGGEGWALRSSGATSADGRGSDVPRIEA